MTDKPSKQISTREGLRFGLTLLSKVTGILVVATIAGALFDQVLHTGPIGLALGALIGSSAATISVVLAVRRKLSV